MRHSKRLVEILLVGGASVIAFVAIRIINPSATTHALIGGVMLALANFVNHPHFSFSYQIFHESWRLRKQTPRNTQLRWLFAGVIAPSAIALYLLAAAVAWINGINSPLAIAINLMGALVGWHYVKQGFGIAMFDAAHTKTFWPTHTRKHLLVNAYICWLTAWVLLNSLQAGSVFWGIFGISIKIPPPITYALIALCVASTAFTAISVWRTYIGWRNTGRSNLDVPWVGIAAYFITLYLWTIFIFADPTFALMIPFFHSIQYLTIVWKYKSNQIQLKKANEKFSSTMKFISTGIFMGAAGFWILPGTLDYLRTGSIPNYTTPALAIACCWLFINIHHYLIDNVLWKQDNPDMKRFLFTNPSHKLEQ